jgi:hypothetical protein
MFQPIWPSSGVKIYLLGKLMIFAVTAVTYAGPSEDSIQEA